jgi:hypothetical protein
MIRTTILAVIVLVAGTPSSAGAAVRPLEARAVASYVITDLAKTFEKTRGRVTGKCRRKQNERICPAILRGSIRMNLNIRVRHAKGDNYWVEASLR